MNMIKQLKVYGFDAREAGNDEVAVQFRIANVKGLGKVLAAFNTARTDVSITGLAGWINFAITLYECVKAGLSK
jgi:hypothetical protein